MNASCNDQSKKLSFFIILSRPKKNKVYFRFWQSLNTKFQVLKVKVKLKCLKTIIFFFEDYKDVLTIGLILNVKRVTKQVIIY